jgi:hypothetical protein
MGAKRHRRLATEAKQRARRYEALIAQLADPKQVEDVHARVGFREPIRRDTGVLVVEPKQPGTSVKKASARHSSRRTTQVTGRPPRRADEPRLDV